MSKLMVIFAIHFFIDMCCWHPSVSYNLPKFCPNASWNATPVIFYAMRIADPTPVSIFVDRNNTVYVAASTYVSIRRWPQGKATAQQTIPIMGQWSVFVALNGDIYVNSGSANKVLAWNSTTKSQGVVMENNDQCYSLFLDINNTIYCSLYNRGEVAKKPLNGSNIILKDFRKPLGIFVHTNFTLYVADSENHRIQQFLPGQTKGVPLAGYNSPSLHELFRPTAVILDVDGYLFITNAEGHIYGQGPNGFRCLTKCPQTGGASGVMSGLRRLSFDSYGNIFATTMTSKEIVKLTLAKNSCDVTTTTTLTTTTTSETTTTTLTTTTTSETTALLTATTTSTTKTTQNSITALQTTTESTTALSTNVVTTTYQTAQQSLSYFFPERCNDSTQIGHTCNTSNAPCSMLEPCQNKQLCKNGNNLSLSYSCHCSDGFYGDRCQNNSRLCKVNPCWNDGTCEDLAGNFFCHCVYGWTGKFCEWKENFCIIKNVTCQNRGVCRPLLRGFRCECLGKNYYSGTFCEISTRKILILQIASKSVSFIAIIIMISTAMFIIIMDILKYCFGIDPVDEERERIRRKKKRKPIIQRFVYVNPPTTN